MDKMQYSKLIKLDPNIPVFFQPWFLDAVSPDCNWDVCGNYIDRNKWGVHPYFLEKTDGIKAVCVPPLTQYMGPFVHIDNSINSPRHFSAEALILTGLLNEIQEKGNFYAQKWGPWQSNWLPAYHCRFNQSSRITFYVDGRQDYSVVKANYSSQVRNKLHNKNGIAIREETAPSILYDMAVESLRKVDKKPKYSSQELERLIIACVKNEGGRQLVAYSATGHPLASVLLLEDNLNLYYYIAGEYAQFRGQNAPTLLVDECIQVACKKRKGFDFTGSMLPNVSKFYQSFGAQIINYNMLTKDNRKNQSDISVENLSKKLLFRF